MKYVIKRNGTEIPFDKQKIVSALEKAFMEVDNELTDYSKHKIANIADYVENSFNDDESLGIEEIQNMVECGLMSTKRKDVARAYIRYRHKREILRQTSKTYDGIMELVELSNDELKDENSNKNAIVASTQRDYMAGEVSKDITNRYLLPEVVRKAHEAGEIHFHDADYFAQHIHNCFSADTKFITSKGLKSFAEFNDGDTVEVLSIDGTWNKATVRNYGKQQLFKYTFYNGKKEHTHTIKVTDNHRWILNSGHETTKLLLGQKLIKPPVIYNQELDFNTLPHDCQLAWCKGFGLGDGTVEYGDKDDNQKNIKANRTRIRLCGAKDLQYLNRFAIDGCGLRNTNFDNGDKEVVIYNYHKEIPEFNSLLECQCFLNGLYCADGNVQKQKNKINFRLQSSKVEVIDFIRTWADTCGLYITKEREETGKATNFTNARPYTICFSFNPDFSYSYTLLNKEPYEIEDVWCLEVENTHNFILEHGIPTGNCCLVNLEDMLQNGTVINKTLIEKPHSFATACNIATQIMAVVASGQYGGQSISLSHLAPFVDISRQKIREDVIKELDDIHHISPNVDYHSKEHIIHQLTEARVKEEIKRGVQTIQYQINTLNTSNG